MKHILTPLFKLIGFLLRLLIILSNYFIYIIWNFKIPSYVSVTFGRLYNNIYFDKNFKETIYRMLFGHMIYPTHKWKNDIIDEYFTEGDSM